jgi:hypothetical protein
MTVWIVASVEVTDRPPRLLLQAGDSGPTGASRMPIQPLT